MGTTSEKRRNCDSLTVLSFFFLKMLTDCRVFRTAATVPLLLGRRTASTQSYGAGRTYYDILGIGKDASQREIKTAYYALARKMHPDANPDDPHAADKFNELSVAYRTLSNEERRRKYDSAGCRDSGASSSSSSSSSSSRLLCCFFLFLF